MATLPAPGTAPGAERLDGPPPSPAVEDGTGVNPGVPLGSMVQDKVGANQYPPQVLSGVLSAGEEMAKMVDSFAQMMPDLAPDFLQVKEALMKALSRVLMAGAAPSSPTAPGQQFPGGGFERGGMPLAS